MDNHFFEVIGLYSGDGANARIKDNRRVALANSCPKLHQIWIYFLEKLGITKEQLYGQIQIGGNIRYKHCKILNYWAQESGIPKSRFCKINVKKNVKTKDYGLLLSNFNNLTFRVIFDRLFDKSLKYCIKDRVSTIAFLRGFFAAEGYVSVNKNGSLATLDIPIKDPKQRAFVKKLFKSLNISPADNGKRLLIHGYLNLKKCDKYDLVSLHPEKEESFKKSYSHLISKGHVPALTKLKIIDSLKEMPKTRVEIANELGKGPSLIHKLLRDLEIKNLVERQGKAQCRNGKHACQIWALAKIPEDPFILTKYDYCKRNTQHAKNS